MIPVNEPVISREAKNNVNQALDTGWLSSAGPFVAQFESEFAKVIGTKYAISVNTGTAALHIALLAAGIGEGDEVIVPAFTMASTWLAVIYTGATPVFVDAELDTYNIDVSKLDSHITPRTKAIIPVHIYGHPVEMDQVMHIAKSHHLKVIEDAAEAHGATYKNQIVGGIGDLGCFSFYANKIITTGEGGMVVTDSAELAEEARRYKDLYHSPEKRFIHEKIGYNYRLTNLQAAVGLGELNHLDDYISRKQRMAGMYNKGLSEIKGIVTPQTKDYVSNVYWMYAIRVSNEFPLDKNALRKVLLEKYQIDTRDFFYPPTAQPILSKYMSESETFPVTEEIANTGLYLPSGLAITDDQISQVIEAIREIS